jgi:hypothetical protein
MHWNRIGRISRDMHMYPPWCLISHVLLTNSVRPGNNRSNHSLVAHPSMVSNVAGITSGLPDLAASSTANNSSLPNCVGPVQEAVPQLVAWRVSDKDSELERFQAELSTSSSAYGGTKPMQITIQHGGHGKAGVPREVFVPFRQISQMC